MSIQDEPPIPEEVDYLRAQWPEVFEAVRSKRSAIALARRCEANHRRRANVAPFDPIRVFRGDSHPDDEAHLRHANRASAAANVRHGPSRKAKAAALALYLQKYILAGTSKNMASDLIWNELFAGSTEGQTFTVGTVRRWLIDA
jgi:hypothetical protein